MAFRFERSGHTITAFDGKRVLWTGRLLTTQELADWLSARALDEVVTRAMRRAKRRPPIGSIAADARRALYAEAA